MSTRIADIRAVLLPLRGVQLLLPNATMSEVIGYQEPTPIEGCEQEWLLGLLQWRQRSVPVVAFETLAGMASDATGHKARIAICNTLNGDSRCPYIGLLLNSIPHLTQINEESIESVEAPQIDPDLVMEAVRVNGQEALIPDLDRLEQRVLQVI